METQRQIDNRLLEMIQRHFPSLPLDDKYTDWQRWLKFANAVRSDALEQAARELEHHCSHWEAWFLKQRAAGEMPTFDEAVTPSNLVLELTESILFEVSEDADFMILRSRNLI